MNEREKTKPKLTAEPAYENAHIVAQDQVERIRELLFDLPSPGCERLINWAHVGTVNHVNELLSQVIAHLESAVKA